MNNKKLIICIIALAIFVVGCEITTPPKVNQTTNNDNNAGIQARTRKYTAYIPLQTESLESLYDDIDKWVEKNQDKEVLSVCIVNATKNSKGEMTFTLPSGALIVFRPKPPASLQPQQTEIPPKKLG